MGLLYDHEQLYLYCCPSGKEMAAFTIPSSVQTIGSKAFDSCAKIKELVVPETVTVIGSSAFSGMASLSDLTLPYLGGYAGSTDSFCFVFGGSTWDPKVPKALKTVTITSGGLTDSAFYNCSSIKDITISRNITSIPSQAFKGCTALTSLSLCGNKVEEGSLVIPAGVSSIGYDAFYGCASLTQVTLPHTVSTIDNGAFAHCPSIVAFSVDTQNPNFCTDTWGVLFNKTMSSLLYYPSSRVWPYYNVPSQTATVCANAFYNCDTLVNLYIPNTVTTIQSGAVSSCPSMTMCLYTGSAAYTYASQNSLTAWYMNNFTMQGIEIYSLPTQTVMRAGSEDFSGLYVAAQYGPKSLQADDYTLEYDTEATGKQMVTVNYMGKTASFAIELLPRIVRELKWTELNHNGATAIVALYDTNGKMIRCAVTTVTNGTAAVTVQEAEYQAAKKIQLLIVDGKTLSPLTSALPYNK